MFLSFDTLREQGYDVAVQEDGLHIYPSRPGGMTPEQNTAFHDLLFQFDLDEGEGWQIYDAICATVLGKAIRVSLSSTPPTPSAMRKKARKAFTEA